MTSETHYPAQGESMPRQTSVYITLDWQEQGPLEISGRRLWQKGRRVCTPTDYPQRLPCHNPDCVDGGFEIGERVATLLASGKDSEQNSLICRNAIHEDRSRRCLHTIIYSIACIRPYDRQGTRPLVRDPSVSE
jgi:hypothetical protein